MANSSSTDQRVDFAFYVPQGKRLIPLRLSENSLEDFNRALSEANCVDDCREEVERTSQSYYVILIAEQQLKQDRSVETCIYQSCGNGLTTTCAGTQVIDHEPQEGDHDPLVESRQSLNDFVLYKYMWSTFQGLSLEKPEVTLVGCLLCSARLPTRL